MKYEFFLTSKNNSWSKYFKVDLANLLTSKPPWSVLWANNLTEHKWSLPPPHPLSLFIDRERDACSYYSLMAQHTTDTVLLLILPTRESKLNCH